jgi:hypothetical protein
VCYCTAVLGQERGVAGGKCERRETNAGVSAFLKLQRKHKIHMRIIAQAELQSRAALTSCQPVNGSDGRKLKKSSGIRASLLCEKFLVDGERGVSATHTHTHAYIFSFPHFAGSQIDQLPKVRHLRQRREVVSSVTVNSDANRKRERERERERDRKRERERERERERKREKR